MTPAKLVKIVVSALEEVKARDIEVLNVTKRSNLFDRMIIASADSNRQTKALANNVQKMVKAGGAEVYGMEGEETGEWILVDLGDVLVHVMQTAVRAHYNLEELWANVRSLDKNALPAASNDKAGAKLRRMAGVAPSSKKAKSSGQEDDKG